MSGHSKWSTIKRKKEKTDAQKAKVFTKIGKELAIAIRQGGGSDPNTNIKLRDCIAKAKLNNVPNDNIERIIKKASQSANSNNFENITYEGYGPGGVAVMVETFTDNRNRTAADLRHYFDKYGGNIGVPGCVSFLFKKQGMFVLEKKDVDGDKLFENSLESGANDFFEEDRYFEIYSEPENFDKTKENLEKKGYKFLYSEVSMIPENYVSLDKNNKIKMEKLLEVLEKNDDVSEIFSNLSED